MLGTLPDGAAAPAYPRDVALEEDGLVAAGNVVHGDGIEPAVGKQRDRDASEVGAHEPAPPFRERLDGGHRRSPRANAAAPRSSFGTMAVIMFSLSGTPAARSRAYRPSRITANLNRASAS